jgi:superfamily II DNA or RNA helicase
MELRQYQKDVLNNIILSNKNGNDKIILQAATGSGKTVMSSALIRYFVGKGSSVVFLAHRRELIIQASKTMSKLGVGHGIIMAGISANGFESVQVASIDTLRARAIDTNKMELPPANLLVIDEAHRSMSPTYLKLIEKYKELYDPLIVGLTATPVRADGTGLGLVYSDMVKAPGIKELTALGSLVEADYYAPTVPDLRRVGTVAGDYNGKDLNEAMDKPKLVGNIVETWKHLANGTSTIVFASGVKHSQSLAEQFTDAGVAAAHLDGSTDNDERERILKEFNDGLITVICNCMVLTEGFDAPIAQTCILARPTKSLSLYIQMVGRVLRPYPGKDRAIVIDHSGAVYTNGFATDEHDWKLGTGKVPENERVEPEEREETQVTCEGCFHVHTGSNICPRCGHINSSKSAYVGYVEGMLGLVSKKTKKVEKVEKYGDGFKKQFYQELLGLAILRKRTPDWAVHKYRARFKEAPEFGKVDATNPGKDTKSYVTYLNIRSARSRRN